MKVKMSDEEDDTETVLRRQPAVRRKGYIWSSKRTVKRSVSHDRDANVKDLKTPVAPPRRRGSSLDLTPTLLTIYDNKAASNGITDDDAFAESKLKTKSLPISSSTRTLDRENLREQKVENDLDKRHTMINPPVSNVSDNLNDTRKRPLSISSMSSASSSSLPRQQYKRPNLAEYDQALLKSESSVVSGSVKDVNGNNKIDPKEMMSARFEKKLNQTMKNDISALKHLESFSKKDNDEKPRNRNKTDVGGKLLPKSLVKPTITLKRSVSDANPASIKIIRDMDNQRLDPQDHATNGNMLQPPSPQGLHVCPDSPQLAPDSPDGCILSKPTTHYVSYVHRVVAEIVDTERTYVKSLEDIIQGYLQYLEKFTEVDVAREDTSCLFSNIRDIYNFSKVFLSELELCEGEPVKVAECFVRNNKGFVIYTEYCTNYPSAVEVLTKFMKDPVLSEVFKHRQQMLGHGLPLGAYLLRPVQRILKYHLLLQNIWKNFEKDKEGYDILEQAFKHMTSMAHHINNMKRKHEHAIKIQEIQSQLEDYVGDDLTRLGELVLESTFRVYGARASRHVFLFEKEILICKKKEGGMLSCKASIQCSNLMLVEVIDNEPLSFHIIPFDNPKAQYTLQARNMEQKRRWCQEIKRLILESYSGKIPDKVKSLVMELGRNHDEDFVSTENLDASRKHQHTAPEYLERRRVRRKSGGKLPEFNLLKPQKAKRGNRKSPDRRRISVEGNDQKNGENRGRTLDIIPRSGQKKSRSLPRGSHGFSTPRRAPPDNYFDSAAHRESSMEITPDVTKRAHSFRRATRLHPITSNDFSHIVPASSAKDTEMDTDDDDDDPNASRDNLDDYNESVFMSRSDLDEETDLEQWSNGNQSNTFERKEDGEEKFAASLPDLIDTDNMDDVVPEVTERPKSYSLNDTDDYSRSTSDLLAMNDGKKINGLTRGRPCVVGTNLPKKKSKPGENSKINAFNDSFRKKTRASFNKDKNSNNVNLVTQHLSKESDVLHAKHGYNAKLRNWASNDRLIKGSTTSLPQNMEDPWVKNSETKNRSNSTIVLQEPQNNNGSLWGRPRNKSDVTDRRTSSRDNLDWMVYVNRNSLNEYPQNVKFLSKYCTPPRGAMTLPNQIGKGVWKSDSVKSDSVAVNSARAYPRFNESHNSPRGTSLSRSNSTPSTRTYLEFGKGFGRNRAASLDLETLEESERIMEEMENYMKNSTTSYLNHAKFPTNLPSQDEKDLNRLSGVSSLSTSSYDSQASHSSSSDGLVGTLKNKISSLTAKISKRNEEYEQMSATSSVSEMRPASVVMSDEEKYDNDLLNSVSPKSTVSPPKDGLKFKDSFNHGKKPLRNHKEPDLQTVLLEGGLGSSTVGSKLAHILPANMETIFTNKSPSQQRPYSACVLQDTDSLSSYDFSSKEGTPEPSSRFSLPPSDKATENMLPTSLKNSEFQQSDSGFSMQSDTTDVTDSCDNSISLPEMSENDTSIDEKHVHETREKITSNSPEVNSISYKKSNASPEIKYREKDKKRTLSNSSSESVDSFYERRLSAALDSDVFRDSAVFCDIEVDPKPELRQKSPESSEDLKMPRKSIKDYVQYLEEKNKPKQPVTYGVRRREPAEIIKQKLHNLQENSQYRKPSSRPVSEERELSPPKCIREIQSTLVAETQGNQFRYRRGRAESEHSNDSLCSSSNSSTLRSARSLGRLDQLNNEVENLVIMKGWVQQLISKFQSDK